MGRITNTEGTSCTISSRNVIDIKGFCPEKRSQSQHLPGALDPSWLRGNPLHPDIAAMATASLQGTISRVLTFLPSVAARAVVVLPMRQVAEQWWVNWTRAGGPGVRDTVTCCRFLIVVVDHSQRYPTAPPQQQ